jgi:hypothetical protein
MMNLMHSSEISLRSAVFNAKKSLQEGENLAEKIKTQALGQIELVNQAEGLITGVMGSDTFQSAAINAAIKGVELAYQAISSELTEARYKRKRFVEECETHLASFSILASKELSEFSWEELAIKKFYEMVKHRCPDIIEYFGINLHQSSEFDGEYYYAVLPFYRMSLALQQNGVIANKIDAHRQAIFLFLKTGLPLSYYYEKFKNYSRIWLQIQGVFNSKNYLNHLKAPRFIISALANLLWNLQHPVNPETGIPLTLVECVAMCHRASMFLNELLNPSQYEYLGLIDNSERHMQQAVSTTELLIKSLQSAFEYDRLHEINLSDISKHMHSALRIMSNKLLELIYQDENASEKLVGQIMIMGELLMQNHDLYNYFHPLQTKFNPKFTNPKARTLIDVLNLFAHQTPGKRNAICQSMIKSGSESHIQFAYQLRSFHQNFLDQFEGIVIMNLKITKFEQRVIFQKTASHFIPLILLVMESFTVFRDTRPKKMTEHAIASDIDESIYDLQNTTHDRKQRHDILSDAANRTGEHYYNWSLSNFLTMRSSFHDSLDMLLSYQNEMRLKTMELDILAFKVSENRGLLLKPLFKNDLLQNLSEIHEFYNDLTVKFTDVQNHMHADLKLHRDQKRVLQPMLDDLEAIIQSIQKSITMVSTIMTSSKFEEQEKDRRAERLGYSQSPAPSGPRTAGPSLFSRTPMQRMNSTQSVAEEEAQNTHLINYFDDADEKFECELPRPPLNTIFTQKFLMHAALSNIFLIGVVLLFNCFWPIFALNFYLSLTLSLACLGLSTGAYFYESITPEELRMPQFTLSSLVI